MIFQSAHFEIFLLKGQTRGQAQGLAGGQAQDQAQGQALRRVCGPYGEGEEEISLIREVCLR